MGVIGPPLKIALLVVFGGLTMVARGALVALRGALMIFCDAFVILGGPFSVHCRLLVCHVYGRRRFPTRRRRHMLERGVEALEVDLMTLAFGAQPGEGQI